MNRGLSPIGNRGRNPVEEHFSLPGFVAGNRSSEGSDKLCKRWNPLFWSYDGGFQPLIGAFRASRRGFQGLLRAFTQVLVLDRQVCFKGNKVPAASFCVFWHGDDLCRIWRYSVLTSSHRDFRFNFWLIFDLKGRILSQITGIDRRTLVYKPCGVIFSQREPFPYPEAQKAFSGRFQPCETILEVWRGPVLSKVWVGRRIAQDGRFCPVGPWYGLICTFCCWLLCPTESRSMQILIGICGASAGEGRGCSRRAAVDRPLCGSPAGDLRAKIYFAFCGFCARKTPSRTNVRFLF